MAENQLKEIGERIAYALAHHPSGKKSQQWLAAKLKVQQPSVSGWIRGINEPKKMHVVADALGVKLEWLLHGDGPKHASRDDSDLPSSMGPMIPVKYGPDLIPIYGAKQRSENTIFLDFSKVVGHTLRHPSQVNIENAYAVMVFGNSMEPRFYEGELAFVAGGTPPRVGGDCLIEMKDGTAYVRQFVKLTDKDVFGDQFNPPKKWRASSEDMRTISAIVGRS